jgi:uncharacterized protein YegP (UPF0339 family)
MSGTFELKKSKNGQYMFNLKAGNGEVILTSELYDTKAAAEHGIEVVRKTGINSANYQHKMSLNGEAYFVLKAANKQIIGKSEMYTVASGMEKGIASAIRNSTDAVVKDLTAE